MSEAEGKAEAKSKIIKKVASVVARSVAAGAILVGGARAVESKSLTQPFKDVSNAARDARDSLSSDNETQVQRLSDRFEKIFDEIHKNESINDDEYHWVHFETNDKNYILSSNKEGYKHLNVHDKATDLNTDYVFFQDRIEKTARQLKPESPVPTITDSPSYITVVSVLTDQDLGALVSELASSFDNKTKAEIFKPSSDVPTIASE